MMRSADDDPEGHAGEEEGAERSTTFTRWYLSAADSLCSPLPVLTEVG